MASGNGLVARALGARTGPRRAQSDVAGQESPGPSPTSRVGSQAESVRG